MSSAISTWLVSGGAPSYVPALSVLTSLPTLWTHISPWAEEASTAPGWVTDWVCHEVVEHDARLSASRSTAADACAAEGKSITSCHTCPDWPLVRTSKFPPPKPPA